MHGGRTRMRQELEKQRLELERKRDDDETWKRREGAGVQQSSSMEVPLAPHLQQQQQQPQVSVDVPSNVLEVRTKLQNPTSYHVNAMQKQQVHRYLSSQGVPIQSRSAPSQNSAAASLPGAAGGAPPRNLTSVSMQKDPLLSGGALNSSPMRPSSLNPTLTGGGGGATGGALPPGGMAGGSMFTAAAGGSATLGGMKSESPTMMSVDQTPDDIQDQIIEDIMGLEEKFGDTLGGLPYLDSVMGPQTLPVNTNLFDNFTPGMSTGGAVSPVVMTPMSASCPTAVKEEPGVMPGQLDFKTFEKDRVKKNNHNMIERRRRFNINDRIKELGMLLPPTETEARQNKGTILKASVDYIQKLQREINKQKARDAQQKQLEESNRKMRLRIQELEITARAHGIPTPSLNPETQKLAEAAEQALGSTSITPRSRSPASAGVTPAGGMFNDELADILRSSPGIDLSKLNIKQEQMDSPSSCGGLGDKLSPSPRPPSGAPFDHLQQQQQQQQQRVGDIFSFNLPLTSAASLVQQPPLAGTNSAAMHLYGNT